jgi:hydroxyquinol 1,2-dioxygenase
MWQANDQGFYDVQPRTNGRGLFTVDSAGEFWFRTIVSSYYPFPLTGRWGSYCRRPRGTRTGSRTSTSR